MSERKVLNKYYPPDFDPSKIPKVHAPKNKKFIVRLMAPCNMRCKTCGEYIYQGKKFNARKEDVLDMNYLGLRIYRFYIKCPKCVAEISFRTDPESTDYVVEAGATRNFEAVKLLDAEEKRLKKQREDEEANNPMKVLENRTKDSKQEMDIMENIEELRELNTRQADVDHFGILREKEEDMRRRQEEDDEAEIRIFGKSSEKIMKRLDDSESEDEETPVQRIKSSNFKRPTDFIHEDIDNASTQNTKKQKVWDRSVGQLSTSSLSSLVKIKKAPKHNKPATMVVKSSATPGTNAGNKTIYGNLQERPEPDNTKAIKELHGQPIVTDQSTVNSEQSTVNLSNNSAQGSVNLLKVDYVQSNINKSKVESDLTNDDTSVILMAHIKEGMVKKNELKERTTVRASGLGLDLLGGYSDSDDSNSDASN
ncbi:splicing factor YJU2-like isoform X2 [Anneissia japonica]|uniref:splicing factor YJU2-like isoform X2 n=1 Tax=Anneissia japonica TaxID=1529436 RepID=UPI0014259AC7|nr:splicing factor YJU2-like isoform X2 [Anneissia japonica]